MIGHPNFPVDPWVIRETALDLETLGFSESIFALANGHLGLRGTLDEGEPQASNGTYLNGFYESHPIGYGERGYGFPEDGQTIVNVTDGSLIRVLVEDEPLDVRRGILHEHERALDLRTGILERNIHWSSTVRHNVRVRSRRLVSFRERSVAAIEFEIEAVEEPLRVAIQSSLLANRVSSDAGGSSDPREAAALGAVLEPRLAIDDGLRVVLAHTTKRSGISLAAGMDHAIDPGEETLTRTNSEPDMGRVTISTKIAPGEPFRMVKLLAYHWSSRQSIEWLRDQVDASLENALAEGFDGLAGSQRSYLEDSWAIGNVELDGDPEVQQALRFAQFQLIQAAARAETRAIPAKGLTGPGYDGHAFWDTEAFVLRALIFSRPRLARDALLWRHSTLELARERARTLGLRGAAFPWRTIHGEECSGYWPAGTAAFHVNADIAEAVRMYAMATGDRQFEQRAGLELLAETARLWESFGFRNEAGEFRVDGVTGPDEYSALGDNNAYTSLMAQGNLRAAADAAERDPETAERLGIAAEEIAAWRDAAGAMRIPYDERLGVHPQSEGFTELERWDFESTSPDDYPLMLHNHYVQLYRKQVVKQADLVLAMFVRGDAFEAEQKRRNFDYYEGLTVRDSSLSACVQAIVAAEVGHTELAYDYLAEAALMDLRDVEGNVLDGLHIASLAGTLLAAVAGLGGLRGHGGRLSFSPRLPKGLERLAFPLAIRGRHLSVEVRPGEATYTAPAGDGELEFDHWGEPVTLEQGSVTLPIPPAEELPRPAQPAGREPKRRAQARGVDATRAPS